MHALAALPPMGVPAAAPAQPCRLRSGSARASGTGRADCSRIPGAAAGQAASVQAPPPTCDRRRAKAWPVGQDPGGPLGFARPGAAARCAGRRATRTAGVRTAPCPQDRGPIANGSATGHGRGHANRPERADHAIRNARSRPGRAPTSDYKEPRLGDFQRFKRSDGRRNFRFILRNKSDGNCLKSVHSYEPPGRSTEQMHRGSSRVDMVYFGYWKRIHDVYRFPVRGDKPGLVNLPHGGLCAKGRPVTHGIDAELFAQNIVVYVPDGHVEARSASEYGTKFSGERLVAGANTLT